LKGYSGRKERKVPFERVSIKSKNELEELVAKEINVIDERLTFIDRVLTETGKIILCHDKDGRLVIVEPRLFQDDKALFDGLRYLDHYDSEMSTLKVDDEKNKVKRDDQPRLILVAPSFSDDILRVVRHMATQISLYEWEYLKMGDTKGLYLKPLSPIIAEERRMWSKLKAKLLEYRRKEAPVTGQVE
jgi:RecB family endonuclease NucS